jgi:hypothetical protein
MPGEINQPNPNHSINETKGKMKRLSALIDFLETDIEKELASNPKKVWDMKDLLEKNLWQSRINPYDYYWDFDSDVKNEADANPGRYSAKEMFDLDTEQGVKVILYFYGLLKAFWEDFKRKMLVDFDLTGGENFLDVKIPSGSFQVLCSNNGEAFSFSSNGVNAIPEFISLLRGIHFNAFKRCKNPICVGDIQN